VGFEASVCVQYCGTFEVFFVVKIRFSFFTTIYRIHGFGNVWRSPFDVQCLHMVTSN
jgi:hypothetical protein